VPICEPLVPFLQAAIDALPGARGSKHEERHPDNGARKCPACGMLLWAAAEPKKLRLHDQPTEQSLAGGIRRREGRELLHEG
jgi:hypothetical protein